MKRWIRLTWIGLTNSLLLLPVLSSIRDAILYGSPWWTITLTAAAESDLIFGAILGFVLDAMQARYARLVNTGIWVWVALKNAGIYFELWGHTEVRWLTAYIAPLSCVIAIVNFLLYRSREELRPNATQETR